MNRFVDYFGNKIAFCFRAVPLYCVEKKLKKMILPKLINI
jgi:hypothetical protein